MGCGLSINGNIMFVITQVMAYNTLLLSWYLPYLSLIWQQLKSTLGWNKQLNTKLEPQIIVSQFSCISCITPHSEKQKPNIYIADSKAIKEREHKWIIRLREYHPFWQCTTLKLGIFCVCDPFSLFLQRDRLPTILLLFPSRRKNHSICSQYSLSFSQFFCTNSLKFVILVLCFFMVLCGYFLLSELTWCATTKQLSWLKVPELGSLMTFLGSKPKTDFLP